MLAPTSAPQKIESSLLTQPTRFRLDFQNTPLPEVTKSLSLLQLPEPIRQQIDAGLISPAAGYELARVEDPQLRSEFAAQVAAGTLTRDALAGKIKASRRPGTDSTESKRSRVTAKLSARAT